MESHREQANISDFRTKEVKQFALKSAVGYDGGLVEPDSKYCVAKFVKPKNNKLPTRYFIKRNTVGGNTRMYNPYEDGLETLKSDRLIEGRSRWEFDEVSEDSYTFYLRYLENGNRTFLASAERMA